jgi:hypothetical protein
MMPSTKSPLPGIILILLGTFFLIANAADLRLESYWPIFVLGPGLAFFYMFTRDRKNYGLLMPATILTVIGILFFVCEFSGWRWMDRLWPLFMMAPGLGFIMMYLFGKRERGLLIPAGILTALGLIFLLQINESGYLWPAVLIALGLLILLKGKKQVPPSTEAGSTQGPIPQ